MRSSIISLSLAATGVLATAAPKCKNFKSHDASVSGTEDFKHLLSQRVVDARMLDTGEERDVNAKRIHADHSLTQFDDITGLPGVAIQPIPMGYNGLHFQSFNLVDSATTSLPVPQVLPHSPPK